MGAATNATMHWNISPKLHSDFIRQTSNISYYVQSELCSVISRLFQLFDNTLGQHPHFPLDTNQFHSTAAFSSPHTHTLMNNRRSTFPVILSEKRCMYNRLTVLIYADDFRTATTGFKGEWRLDGRNIWLTFRGYFILIYGTLLFRVSKSNPINNKHSNRCL